MGDTTNTFGAPPAVGFFSRRQQDPLPLTPYKSAAYAVVCLLWISFGLIGRDPWKPTETDFVVLIAEFIGAIPDLPATARPQQVISLYPLMAAATARLFSPLLDIHEGARLINLLLLTGGFVCVGFAVRTYHGGRAGWMTVLLAMGAAGFMIRAHLLNLAVPAFFGIAALVWAATRLRRHALVGGMAAGSALGFLFITALPAVAAAGIVSLLLTLWHHKWRRLSHIAGLAITTVFFVLWTLLWNPIATTLGATISFNEWLQTGLTPHFDAGRPIALLRIAAWALFPVLPAALAALWLRRHTLPKEPLPFFCLTLAVAGFGYFALYGNGEEDSFLLLPPLAVFAACGLARMSNNHTAILDWFALGVVGFGAVGGLWGTWLVLHTDFWPDFAGTIRARFAFLPPPTIVWWKVAVAASITLLWVCLAANFGRSNERSVLNWSAGITALWSIFNLLWVNDIDAGKSYRHMAAAITAKTQGGCFTAHGVDSITLGQLAYFGAPLRVTDCHHALQPATAPPAGTVIWRGGRYDRKNYILYMSAP